MRDYQVAWRGLEAWLRALREALDWISVPGRRPALMDIDSWSAQLSDFERALWRFLDEYGTTIPDTARSHLTWYRERGLRGSDGGCLERKAWLGGGTYIESLNEAGRIERLFDLGLVVARAGYLMTDWQEAAERRTELAMIHLQRVLAIDPLARERWLKAFERDTEMEVEGLGAVHLLQHGIFAFKAYAPGGRTDLVFGRPIDNEEVDRSGAVLVLTEWKLVREPANAGRKAREARSQIELYAGGVLAAVELSRVRYAVLVSRRNLDPISDIECESHVVRHVNIAITPDTPSVAAR